MPSVEKKTLKVSGQELDDLITALGFFIGAYPPRKENPITLKAMKTLKKKLWRVVRSK
jgi:hypothetical protein